jgi:hypothetical protein
MPSGELMIRLPGILNINGHWLLTGEGPMRPVPINEVERWVAQMPPELFRAVPRPVDGEETSDRSQ